MSAAAGLLLLAIVIVAVWTNGQFAQRRAEVERDALQAARDTIALADAEAKSDSRMLQLMASSPAAKLSDMERMTRFFDLGLSDNPAWNGLVLRDVASGRVLLEKGRGPGHGGLRALPPRLPDGLGVEGVFAKGRYCPCVVFHKRTEGRPERALTLFMAPQVYQQILQRKVAKGAVGGLVDGGGRFLGRSLDYAQRVGTPATPFVRRAVSRGGEGFYRGTTYEGFRNVTAYAVSPATGWSGHIAVGRASIDSPRSLANASMAIAVLAALILATGLLFYAASEMRTRRRQEARLVAMQKAEAISRFTGTIVHDSRNILAAIDAGARMIVRGTEEPRTVELANGISDAVARGNRLTNQLLSFVRGDGAEVSQLDLKKCLEGCDDLIARALGDGIKFRWSVADDARHAHANADQLELALLNLAINARDAMDGNGTFVIDVTCEGAEVALAACDTGPGVPTALRERIFEAFYSTKGDGKGTGLGLAQVAGAARQAGGRVELKDGAEGGACFVIYLPRAE